MPTQSLNTKRVILVGFAFFLITAFWQAYDAIIPLMLTNRFGLPQTASGAIMALDNIFALFMLPLFGSLSDKSKSKYGKRTPFIFIGTLCAIVSFVVLTLIDNFQLAKISDEIRNMYPTNITDVETKNEMLEAVIGKTLDITLSNPLPLILFIIALLVVLISMATFRSPAVALMPDITVKPLRSKANAIINLMGTAGGIFVLVLGMVFGTSGTENVYMQYTSYIIAVCALMAVALAVFIFTVKEKKWNREMLEEQAILDQNSSKEETVSETDEKLPKEKLHSLLLILASVALWFTGYNAVTTKYSLYATNILEQNFNLTLIIAQAAAVISYVPVGIIASKYGRKKTILAGVLMLAAAFTGAIFITSVTPPIIMYFLFALAGIAWATINVNSFPMVVELAKGSNIGKYTGYYYTASMSAQVITPIFSGFLMDMINYRILFPYAAIFVILSFVTMFFVRHGNAQDLGGKSAKELISDNFSNDD